MHKQKHISEGSRGVRWQKRQPWSPVSISAPSFLPALGFIDFRLNGCCRCRAETTALLCWCNILLSNKHQPGCQHKQLVLFRAVSFKGDELEWLEWCSQVGGIWMLFTLIYRNRAIDELNGFVSSSSYWVRLTLLHYIHKHTVKKGSL